MINRGKGIKSIKIWAVIFWLAVWQAVSMALDSDLLLVSPVNVLCRLTELTGDFSFWSSILFSFSRIAEGFFLAVLTGIILAALSARYKAVEELIAPMLLALRSVPAASFIILALIWFSSRNLTVLIAFIMVFPIIYTNVLTGISEMDKKMIEMADVFEIPEARRIKYLYICQVMPFLRSGCAAAAGLAWKSGVMAEIIGMPVDSIGEKLQQAKIYLDTPDLFAWTLVIVIMSLIFEKLLMLLLKFIQKLAEL